MPPPTTTPTPPLSDRDRSQLYRYCSYFNFRPQLSSGPCVEAIVLYKGCYMLARDGALLHFLLRSPQLLSIVKSCVSVEIPEHMVDLAATWQYIPIEDPVRSPPPPFPLHPVLTAIKMRPKVSDNISLIISNWNILPKCSVTLCSKALCCMTLAELKVCSCFCRYAWSG